jgi:hypothetical protein
VSLPSTNIRHHHRKIPWQWATAYELINSTLTNYDLISIYYNRKSQGMKYRTVPKVPKERIHEEFYALGNFFVDSAYDRAVRYGYSYPNAASSFGDSSGADALAAHAEQGRFL